MKRSLVIRGGAIGDFILTLPALKALRDAYPYAHIAILGYKHIAVLAENRFYAQAVRSIEYGPLSTFFAKNAELPSELVTYFAGFDLLISYLYDPDGIFEGNLRRCGVELLIRGPAKIDKGEHAARQLARPMQELGLAVEDLAAKVYPSSEDRQRAQQFLRDLPRPLVVFHPGSGSKRKNWPLENWIDSGNGLLALDDFQGSLVIVSGEADEDQVRSLRWIWKNERVRFAKDFTLPELAAVFENAIFVGHDSGISQLAAAAGANCILLFGPSDAEVWAPKGKDICVIRSKSDAMEDIDLAEVRKLLTDLCQRDCR
ncbi:MAG TPA: glycosyltransferase family 9 protein [Candidatus Binatus sp.]|nr:glycosyltransferase family 9 protein [Candidatus Binatus sp.]